MPRGFRPVDVRPYQLMCIVCRLGDGHPPGDLGMPNLTNLLRKVRRNPILPLRLRCNVDSIYAYQNPGRAEDTPEGELFNDKRDLDIVQKLGLVPGDTRPAIDLFDRLLEKVPTAKGVCGYETVTSETWQGCARACGGNYEKGHALGLKAIIPPRDSGEKARVKGASAAEVLAAGSLRIRPHHLMCMTCFHGGKETLAPIQEDNLFEAIEAIRKNPDIPVTLIPGCCMICTPCSLFNPKTGLCIGGKSMGLRDQKKDLDVLQKLGLKYGDTLPARQLYERLYARIPSTRDVCAYGDGEVRGYEWRACGGPEGNAGYPKARAAKLGIRG